MQPPTLGRREVLQRAACGNRSGTRPRRASFQIHLLWMAWPSGSTFVMLNITGSALVYRNETDLYFATPRPQYQQGMEDSSPRTSSAPSRRRTIRAGRLRGSATGYHVAIQRSKSGSKRMA